MILSTYINKSLIVNQPNKQCDIGKIPSLTPAKRKVST